MLNDRVELTAAGSKGSDNSNLYVYGDHLGSTILALDTNQKEAMRLGYSPFGQVYRKQNNTKFWKLNSGVNANNQLNQLMPYQYTGRYTEGATGYTNLDARWYNPYTQRFNQPDYWNFSNTGLPTAVQHELMQFTGLNTAQLLRDPSQQMRYGYVKGNPLKYLDPFGLADYICNVDNFTIPLRKAGLADIALDGQIFRDSVIDMTLEVNSRVAAAGIDDPVDLSDYNTAIGERTKLEAAAAYLREMTDSGLGGYSQKESANVFTAVTKPVAEFWMKKVIKAPTWVKKNWKILKGVSPPDLSSQCDSVKER